MNTKKLLKTTWMMIILLTGFTSCSKEWDDHYYSVVSEKSDLNLYEYISSQPNLTKFKQMLQLTGYDSILMQNHTYTVWAPDDQSLSGFDMTNQDMVLKTVKNHISHYTLSTSQIDEKVLTMLNGKLLNLVRTPDGFTLQGKKLTRANIAVKNGMIHVLEAYVPYVFNIWEYLFRAEGVDSVKNYINSLTKKVFDNEASYLDGVLMDSVFVESNKVLSKLALLNVEDSSYTAVFPDNNAWNAAYNKVKPYFKTLDADGGSAAQEANTRWIMVRDLFFSGKKYLPLTNDTLFSTYGTALTNGPQLIPGTSPVEMSNGVSYISSAFNLKSVDSWHKTIKVEAESTTGRVTGNYEAVSYSSIGTSFNVSKGNYLYLRDISTLSTSRLFASFQIPNTLSAKYNVYCVVVPTYISDTTDVRPYKLRFSINYEYVQGVKRDSVWFTETGTTKSYTAAKVFTSDPKLITKIPVVMNYAFPWANLSSTNTNRDLITGNKVRVGIRVENATTSTTAEKAKFNRNVRIDCIILEPVE
jgi:hypothetical protein